MEPDRIYSNVVITEEKIRNSVSKWIAAHSKDVESESLRLLANVVSADFKSLPKLEVHHSLQTSCICAECLRRGITAKHFPDSFINWSKDILKKRPIPKTGYDQAPVNIQQAFMNIAYLAENMTDESTFAFLGDDDFHSLLLAKLLPKLSITVFEADTRIISAIRKIADQESLKVFVVQADMRDGIPENYHCKFNGFYSDPPYSESGILLFLYWGMTLLVEQRMSWGVVAIPFTLLPLAVREMLLVVQKYILQNGFLIEETIPFFKQSPSVLGIISGIVKCQRINIESITPPPKNSDLYEHFY